MKKKKKRKKEAKKSIYEHKVESLTLKSPLWLVIDIIAKCTDIIAQFDGRKTLWDTFQQLVSIDVNLIILFTDVI